MNPWRQTLGDILRRSAAREPRKTVIVVKSGSSLDEASVIQHCKSRMAPFKVPKRVVFLDSLPKNPSGKLLKRELRQRLGGR